MKHLNYFQPYTKTDNHEDHLTRAFLALLRLSNTALQNFYGYVYHQLESNNSLNIKPQFEMKFQKVNFQTQVGALPESVCYLSVLITNEPLIINQDIVAVQRTPVYDGVIEFAESLVMFIETKPDKFNVWEDQLCPAAKDIPEDSILINRPAVLEWKTIINLLHNIDQNPYSNPTEKLLIGDFFAFINERFDKLNPYNEFSKCHSAYLAGKRVERILLEIACSEDRVDLHTGWGYNIQVDFPEIKKVALILEKDGDGNWTGLTIAADFGSIVSQARRFYARIPSYDVFDKFTDWQISCNLHLAVQSSNIVFITSPLGCNEKYFNYWKRDVWTNFGGVSKDTLADNLLEYEDEGIIIYDDATKNEVANKIFSKKYPSINICPALYCTHHIAKADAIALDAAGKIQSYVKGKMTEILSVLDYPMQGLFK